MTVNLNIDMDYAHQINKVNRWGLDYNSYVVPNLIGKSKKDLKPSSFYKYAIYGDGEKVVYQSPEASSKIYEGDTIMLYLE